MTAFTDAGLRRFLMFVALSLVTRLSLVDLTFIDLDESAHILGAWTLLDGQVPYRDFVDNKPPLVYVYYALAQLLLPRGMAAVRWVTTLLVLPMTAYAASAWFRHDRRGLVAGALYLIYGAAFLGHDMLAANCELLGLLPAAWALVLLTRPDGARPLLAGVLLGAATLFKPQFGLWVPAVGWALLGLARPDRAGRWARVATFLAGGAAALVVCYLCFAAAGAGDDFLYWLWRHNLGYAANPISAGDAIWRAVTRVGPFLLTTGWLWWAAWRSRPLLDQTDPYRTRLLGALLIASVPAMFVGFRFFPHYFIQLYLPLALASAPWLAELLRRPWRPAARWFVAHTAVALIGFAVANTILYRILDPSPYEEVDPIYEQVGRELATDVCAGPDRSGKPATLFVWGYAPPFYYHARRFAGIRPASRFVIPQASLSGFVPGNPASFSGQHDGRGHIRPEHRDLLMADLERNQVTYILDTAPAAIHYWQHYPVRSFPRLQAYLDQRFVRVGSVRGVDIYRRRDCLVERNS